MACFLVLNFFCLKRVYNSPGCDQPGRLFVFFIPLLSLQLLNVHCFLPDCLS